MLLTCKTRICPTLEQQAVLWALSEKCRLLYNFALAERNVVWQQEQHFPPGQRQLITYIDQQNALPALKERYPEYKWVYSKVLQLVLRTLDADYMSFFALRTTGDKKARPPKFKGKAHFCTLKYNQSGFQVHNGLLTLSHKHPSKILLAFELPYHLQGVIKHVEIYYDSTADHWGVSLVYEVSVPPYRDNGLYQAIDLGIQNLVSAVNLAGKTVQYPNKRPDLYWRGKLAVVQARRDHCRKGSRKWHWYHRKYCRMKRKLANQLRDYQHFVAYRVVTQTKANTIVIGEQAPKKMAQKEQGATKATNTLHHSLQNTGFLSRFAEFLTYKAEKLGKRVIRISEAYTTQICCNCGRKEHRPLSERLIACNCGTQIDRDINAAINILVAFLTSKAQFENLLLEPSVNEESFLHRWKDFLRYTAKHKAKASLAPLERGWADSQEKTPVVRAG
ncbi:MAG: RNA-guided endonuclease InsQ/TnpB family protein [Candidatus Hodarchaeales archaeon]